MPQRLLRCSLVLSLCALPGCISLKNNPALNQSVSAQPELKTREDVIRNLGIPANVLKAKGNTYYTYVYTEGYGGGLGLGNMALSLLVSHTKVKSDTYVVEMDPKEQVVDIYTLAQTDHFHYTFWPFGE
jgi:outer membrane protein assembly factor BamE (lipoprotein component of BamABCDE complex)